MSIQLTDHFSLQELTITNNKKLKDKNYQYGILKFNQLRELANFCEQVRKILNCPMIITSGIRCLEVNEAIGGASNSSHLKGTAVDFITTKIKIKTAFDKIRNSNLEFGQLIYEKTDKSEWIHISMGATKQVLTYNGKEYKSLDQN